jgi:hypothetical protein
MSPFDFLNAINDSKKNLFEDPQADKDYNSFIINKGLSYFPDTILYGNEMNRNSAIPKKWQFDFLVNSIPKKRRFSKWHKKDDLGELIELVMKHYKYSKQKAYEVISLLKPEQIEDIRRQYDTGGRNS